MIEDWMAVWPVAQGAMNQVWQVAFHFQNGATENMTATHAYSLGYGFNTTATRVLFRTPYNTQQTEVAMVREGPMFTKIQNFRSGGKDPPTFSTTALRWTTPRIMPSLVAFPHQFEDEAIEMGVDGRRIDSTTIGRNGYSFLTDSDFISITVPIGAAGGITESDVIDNRYGTMYSIKLLLDHRWRGDESDRTRHRIFKFIRTPFAPQIPVLIDNTVPERGYFDVSIGNFLADVDLSAVAIGGKLLTPPEIKGYGCTLEEVPNANHTRVFILKVPFSNPLVEQKSMFLGLFFFSLVLPVFEGFCDGGQIGVVVTRGTLDRYWVPYVGSLQLTNELAVSQNYTVQDDGSYFYLFVPFLATGLIYEVLCLPNGTMTAIMLSLDTKPELNPRRTHLRDKDCRPVAVDDTKALFIFSVATCGTIRR
ncbi:hypothetical protein Chor_009647, partial [Crotalus horridus]